MSIQDKIAALPEWPKISNYMDPTDYGEDADRAALARIALAREWIMSFPHPQPCAWKGLTRDTQGLLPDCNCGRDALLAALEPPK